MTTQPIIPPMFATSVLLLLAAIAVGVLWIGYRTRPAQITVAIESVKATAEWTDSEWEQLVAQLADVHTDDPATTNVVPMTRQRGRNTRNSRPAPEPGGES